MFKKMGVPRLVLQLFTFACVRISNDNLAIAVKPRYNQRLVKNNANNGFNIGVAVFTINGYVGRYCSVGC